jgi:hypothetical protein
MKIYLAGGFSATCSSTVSEKKLLSKYLYNRLYSYAFINSKQVMQSLLDFNSVKIKSKRR